MSQVFFNCAYPAVVYYRDENPTIFVMIMDNSTRMLTDPCYMEFLQDVTGSEILELFGHDQDDVQLCREGGKPLIMDESLSSQGVMSGEKILSNFLSI